MKKPRRPSPGTLLGTGAVLLLLAAAILWVIPSNQYLFLPDKARPVAPVVTVKGGHDPAAGQGGIYYDAVIVKRARLFETLFHFVHSGETLVPANLVNPPGVSDSKRRQEDLRDMATSQQIAAAVALKYLGKKVVFHPQGALIEAVAPNSPASAAGMQPTDIIVAIDGKRVRTTADVRRLMALHKPGDKVKVGLRNGKGIDTITAGTTHCTGGPPDCDASRAVFGILVKPAVRIQLPFPVQIDTGQIGGPSAGLAFALDIVQELGHDITHGYKVAATGELDTDGTVNPIGGAKQKAIGAKRAGVDVFLVPAGDNYKDARKWAGGVKVIPVESFQQALHVLATLPPKPKK